MLSLGIGVEGMGVDGANDEALAKLLAEMDGLGTLISSWCSRRREQREKIRAAMFTLPRLQETHEHKGDFKEW
jgi:hypothetical protein